MAYTRYEADWQDGAGGGTPIVAAALDHMEAGILAANQNAAILVAASNARQAVKDRADYVCDGTADDVQIQAALDALPAYGGRVELSEGQFTVAATVVMPDKPCSLLGAGPVATSIKAANGLNDDVLEITGQFGVVSDLQIDGNKANQTAGSGIRVLETKYWINRIWIDSAYADGIAVGNGADQIHGGKVTDALIINVGQDGVSYTSLTYDSHLLGVWIGNAGRNGIRTSSGTQTFGQCHVWGCEDDGIRILAGNSTKIENCYVETNGEGGGGGRGIRVGSNADAGIITGCYIWKNASGGVYLFEADRWVVTGNIVEDNGGSGHAAGIVLDDSDYTVVTSNQFWNRSTDHQGRPLTETNGSDYTIFSNNTARAADHFTGGATITGANSVARGNNGLADYPAPTLTASYISGDYYGPHKTSVGASSTAALTNGETFFTPFWVASPITVDRIGAWLVTNGSAGSVARFGIFRNSATNTPGTLVVDGGTVATDTGQGAIRTVTVSQPLTPGWYWLSCSQQGGAATGAIFRRSNIVVPPGPPGWYGTPESTMQQVDGYTASITGALASTPTVTQSRGGFMVTTVVRVA